MGILVTEANMAQGTRIQMIQTYKGSRSYRKYRCSEGLEGRVVHGYMSTEGPEGTWCMVMQKVQQYGGNHRQMWPLS